MVAAARLTWVPSAGMDLSLVMDNLLSPPILFFVLGITAGLLKSDLAIPEAVTKLLSLYLMWAIGIKGGVKIRESGLSPEALGRQGGQHVRGERRGDLRLVVAAVAVVEQSPGRHDAGSGVGDVVRQHLVVVDAVGGESGDRGVEDTLCDIE